MNSNSNNTWEQPFQVGDKTEPIQSFEAFQIWLEMGSKRSLKAVAERVEKSHDTIKKYSCTWKWSERLQDKLTYENQRIHGKQLEAVLYSLEVDNKRDLITQQSLGNLATLIWNETIKTNLGDNTINTQTYERKLSNPDLEYLERLLNLYCKLEKAHNEHQKKYVSLNNECLQYSSFDKQEDYMKMLLNAESSQKEILTDIADKYQKFKDENNTSLGGVAIMQSNFFKPLEPYKDKQQEEQCLDGNKPQLEE